MTSEGGDAPTGVAVLAMVDPHDVARLAVDHGEAGDALHVTLGYAARPAADYSPEERADLLERLTGRAGPFAADPFGVAVLNPHSDDRDPDPCVVVLVQSADLGAAHDAIVDALAGDASTTFPLYVPHVTIGYGLDIDDVPETAFDGPLAFDRVVVSWAGELIDVTRTAATKAAETFARGWASVVARHDRPVALTARAEAALEALTRIAEDAGDLPITPTLKLGQLEGKWAVIYDRRNEVEARHAEALKGVLDKINALDWTDILDRLSSHSTINPGADRAAIAADLRTAIADFIEGHLSADDLRVWRQAMTAALIDASAEGTVTAITLLADAMGIAVDFDLIGAEAKAALADGRVFDDAVEKWIAEQLDGLGYELGQDLSRLWEAGADRAELEQAIADLLGADRNNAGRILDYAISKALSMGAVDTYEAAGLEFVDFVTAGDNRVCTSSCGPAEERSPYTLAQAPQPGLHVECRCCLAPSAKVAQQPAAALALVQTYALDDDEELAA